MSCVQVIRGERGAYRPARVASGRLNPDSLKGAIPKDLAVGNAVERDASGETEVRQTEFRSERAGQPQHDLVGDRLDRRGDIHVELFEQHVRLPCRASE